jgi:hypothetical protein
MNYSEKLKDPRWQKLRLEIFNRDAWTCQKCLSKADTLTVHHKFYFPGKEPWDYGQEELITLCESCHEEESFSRPEYEKNLIHILRSQGYLADDVFRIFWGIYNLNKKYSPKIIATMIEFALSSPNVLDDIYNKHIEHIKNQQDKRNK